MKIERKPVNFEDARGTITDIFVRVPKEHCTIIHTKKGGVRGNHYHKLSRQHDFIVSGSMKVYGQVVGQDTITEAVVGPNDLIVWEPGEAHEFVALDNTIFITFVDGPRGGSDFEKDTFRLPTPLHEQVNTAKS